MSELTQAIIRTGNDLGVDPLDIATAISYETGGTFNPWAKGPVTQYGQHIGLIQWGEPQRERYGVSKGMSVSDQMFAVEAYLRDAGVKPGMGLLDIYSAINAGEVGLYDASDEDNGGAPGTVREKVNFQMQGHRQNAEELLGGTYVTNTNGNGDYVPQYEGGGEPNSLGAAFTMEPVSYRPLTEDDIPKGDPGLFQLMADAVLSQGTIAAITRINPSATYNPDYELTEEKLRGYLGDDLDAATFAPWFEAARSEEHAQAIREAALRYKARKDRLAQAGLAGAALQMGAEILDPVALAAEVVTAGALTPVIAGAKAGRIIRAGRAALLAGTSAAAGQAADLTIDPNKDGGDVLSAAVWGAGLGGVAGALMRNPVLSAEGAEIKRIANEQVRHLEARVNSPVLEQGSTAGARQIEANEAFIDGRIGQLGDEVSKTPFSWTRWFDITGQLRTSKNPLTRLLGGVLAKDAVDPTNWTASEDMHQLFEGWTRAYFSTFNPAVKEFIKERGIKWRDFGKKRDAVTQFNEDVARYVRDRDYAAGTAYNKHVVRVGNKIREIQKEIKDLAQNPYKLEGLEGRSVKGFEELADNPFYMMRVWDNAKIERARAIYGEAGIRKAVEAAMAKVAPDVEKKLRGRAAKAFTRAIVNRAHGLDDEVFRKLGSDDLDDVLDVLTREGGMDIEDAKDLMSKYRAKSSKPLKGTPKANQAKSKKAKNVSDAEKAPRAKQRLFIDETTQVEIPRMDGTGSDSVSLQDLLLVNDANYLVGKYIRQMAGRVALARVKMLDPIDGTVIQNGIVSDREMNKLVSLIKRKAADAGVSEAQTERDTKRVKFLFNYITGRPLFDMDTSQVAEWLRALERYNFVRIANQFGMAQLPEFASTLSTAGIKAMFTHMPAFRRIVSDAGDLRLKDDFFHDLEVMNAYGTDVLTHNDYMRMDDLSGSPFSRDRGRIVDKVNSGLNSASHVVAQYTSGLNLINMTMQRMATASIVQKFVDMAYAGKTFSKARMRALGLDEKMTERVYKQLTMKSNVETTKGWLTGNKIKRLHMDRWTDPQAAEAFKRVISRATRQMVQTNDIGMLSKWMSHPLGRLLVQFRRFAFGSWTNNLLYNINLMKQGDLRAGNFFLLSTLLSGINYIGWTYLNSIGRDDQGEYLKDRLSLKNISLGAFSRSGYSSVIPMMFDSTIGWATGGPLFASYRSSGQPSDILFGNPSGDLYNSLQSAVSAITHPLINQRGMTAPEAHDLVRLLPFSNALPLVIGLNSMTSGLEQRRPRDDFSFNDN